MLVEEVLVAATSGTVGLGTAAVDDVIAARRPWISHDWIRSASRRVVRSGGRRLVERAPGPGGWGGEAEGCWRDRRRHRGGAARLLVRALRFVTAATNPMILLAVSIMLILVAAMPRYVPALRHPSRLGKDATVRLTRGFGASRML